MLTPPSKGFSRSVSRHNVSLDSLAEWIEGCVTFSDSRVSQSDVSDILLEEQIYSDADFANERIADAWRILKWRKQLMGDCCTFQVRRMSIDRICSWTDTPAYSFCLMLGLRVAYANDLRACDDDPGIAYLTQGELFERLTAESLSVAGWVTHLVGWSKKASNSLLDKLEDLATRIGESTYSEQLIRRWTRSHVKDAGLDVVCHFPFEDNWTGRPLMFVQCASGDNWMPKRSTPDLNIWDKLLDYATRPTRGIAIPFALLEDDFRLASNCESLSLLLDRHRLCAPSRRNGSAWLSDELTTDLNKWTEAYSDFLVRNKSADPIV